MMRGILQKAMPSSRGLQRVGGPQGASSTPEAPTWADGAIRTRGDPARGAQVLGWRRGATGHKGSTPGLGVQLGPATPRQQQARRRPRWRLRAAPVSSSKARGARGRRAEGGFGAPLLRPRGPPAGDTARDQARAGPRLLQCGSPRPPAPRHRSILLPARQLEWRCRVGGESGVQTPRSCSRPTWSRWGPEQRPGGPNTREVPLPNSTQTHSITPPCWSWSGRSAGAEVGCR